MLWYASGMELTNNGRCKPPFRYPRRVKDVALETWGFLCSRDFACTERELAKLGEAEQWPCLPGAHLLGEWAKAEDWPGEIAHRLRLIAPDMAERAVVDLIIAGCEGARFIRDVMAGRATRPSGIQARLAQFGVQAIGLDTLARAHLSEAITASGQPSPHPSALPPGSSGVDSADALRSAVVARLLAAEHEDTDS